MKEEKKKKQTAMFFREAKRKYANGNWKKTAVSKAKTKCAY